MSAHKKTRKNAGEGYGYMFHGAFSEKKDAVAKEKKTKGAWIKPTLTNKGYRYIVMSPRLNPIKRKKNPKMQVFFDNAIKKFTAALYHPKHGNIYASGHTKKEAAKNLKDRMRDIRKSGSVPADHGYNANPHELLIMGANPHGEQNREITLPAGSTLTIRMNPTEARQNPVNPDRYSSAQAIAKGISRQAPGLIQTKKQRRVAKMVRGARRHKYDWIPPEGIAPGFNPGPDDMYMIQAAAELFGKALKDLSAKEMSKVAMRAAQLKQAKTQPRQNVELGTYENGVFHPWTRRPKSRQKKAIRRQNPDAAGIREDFTGMPVEHEHVRQEPHMPAGNYAQLGKLLSLYVKPRAGGQVLEIKATGVIVVSDESARQIWFVGGDQDVTAALAQFGAQQRIDGLYELGEARRIDYAQRKEHVPDPEQDHWRHNFGEETNEHPTVLFDRTHKRLLLEGGAYEIRREGIVN
jgi:hypothetical protein